MKQTSTGRDLLQQASISQTTRNTKPIVRLFRALASMMQHVVSVLSGGNALDPDQLDLEYRQEQKHEDAIRRRYSTAIIHQAELDARAARHGVKFSPMALPHHQAAILDFLDDPTAPSHLTPMHAMQFQALDEAGNATFTMTHPVNRAAFLITQRYAARHGWRSQQYSAERARWTIEQWLDHEMQERQQLRDVRAACAATGTLKILQVRDFRPERRRPWTLDSSPS